LTVFYNFLLVDSIRNSLLSGKHTTPIMSLHYLVKYKYPKPQYLQMAIKSGGKFFKYLSEMLNMSYNKF